MSKEPSDYSLPVSPQLSGNIKQGTTGEGNKLKLSKVIQELVMTEKVYQSDMLLVKQVYYDRAFQNSPLDKSDIKIIFSNLMDILSLENEFVELLESAAGNMNDNDDNDNSSYENYRIGMAFRQMMSQIDHVYCEYCKRHEDAVLRLQELDGQVDVQEFFNDCQEKMQGKTTSWDLGSMLIKPVQRVLKYPLLLREIFLLTPTEHADHDDLAAATQEIQEVADHINEIKRRKDIVEKIVGDKKKTDINVVHGFNKKLTRRAQRFKQVAGFSAEATQDASFDTLHLRFEEQQLLAQQLARDVQGWVRQVKNHFEIVRLLAENAEVLYASWGGIRVKSMNSIRDFHQAATMFCTVMARELDIKVQGRVQSRIDSFLKVFENPAQVINKRAQKLLDYDRVRDIKSKGDVPDKALQDSADAYVSINAQLVDELPKFFRLTSTYFEVLIGELVSVQTSFYEQMTREWHKLVQRHYIIHDLSMDTIMIEHTKSMQVVDNLIYDITPLNKELWESVPGAIPETPPPHTAVGYIDDASSINDSSTRSIATSTIEGSPNDNYFP
ncbi:Dbl homology domain-containing protein [Circinella umbellata]|nr:Dbl homology domain-containing protein [Circinella umbellata]